MSDLLTDARETFADISSRRPGQTHYDGCRTEHVGCLLAELVAEIERLREAIRRLAEQDATLSVCDGNVTVTMDATLTADEREAIDSAARIIDAYEEEMDGFGSGASATLRGLLERL